MRNRPFSLSLYLTAWKWLWWSRSKPFASLNWKKSGGSARAAGLHLFWWSPCLPGRSRCRLPTRYHPQTPPQLQQAPPAKHHAQPQPTNSPSAGWLSSVPSDTAAASIKRQNWSVRHCSTPMLLVEVWTTTHKPVPTALTTAASRVAPCRNQIAQPDIASSMTTSVATAMRCGRISQLQGAELWSTQFSRLRS